MGEGLTGWLTPEGKLLKCKYGEHHKIAKKIVDKNEELAKLRIIDGLKYYDQTLRIGEYVPMGSGSCSYIHLPEYPKKLTEKQLKWFKRNFNKLDEEQQEWLNEYGTVAGWQPLS